MPNTFFFLLDFFHNFFKINPYMQMYSVEFSLHEYVLFKVLIQFIFCTILRFQISLEFNCTFFLHLKHTAAKKLSWEGGGWGSQVTMY